MKHFLRLLTIVPFFLFLFVGWLYAESVTDNAPVLENASLQIVFCEKTAGIAAWKVFGKTIKGVQDLARFSDRQLKLTGTIADRPIADWVKDAGGWQVEESLDNEIVFRLSGKELPFVIEKKWHLSGRPWLASLHLTVTAVNDLKAPSLSIELGPGIGDSPVKGLGISDTLYSFTEVIYKDAGEIQKYRIQTAGETFRSDSIENLDWIGLHSRYFAFLLVPRNSTSEFSGWMARTPENAQIFYETPSFETILYLAVPASKLKKGASQEFSWDLFGGGKSYSALKQSKLGIQAILFAGQWEWMRFLTIAIMHILYGIQSVVNNWGVAIIVLAVLVRIMIHPIARKAMASQKKFADLQAQIQPEIREIKKMYTGGEQSERILFVYKKYGVNPLAGLKPLLVVLIQLPIFVSLFHLLGQAFELRDVGFLWMETLAEPDRLISFGMELPFFGSHFNLLPLIMTITNMISIKLPQTAENKDTGKLKKNLPLIILAIVFFLLFYSFPSGMVLYWTMANVLHVIHQQAVNR